MPESDAHFRRRDTRWAWLGLLLLLAWDAGGADLPLTRLFGTVDGFAWRHYWLFERVLHDGAAWCLRAMFVLLGLNVLFPLPLIGAMPRALHLRWWLMTLLCALLISLLKRHSLLSCPWSLAEFGGNARYLTHASLDAWRGASPSSAAHWRCARCRCVRRACGWRSSAHSAWCWA
jgi:membrane-associated PAP2 superfamily phosphatase